MYTAVLLSWISSDFGRENTRKTKEGYAMEDTDVMVPSTAGTENVNKAIEVSLAKKIKNRGSLRGAATKLRNHISE